MAPRGWWTDRPRLALAGAVALGLVLRSVHFLRNPSVWHDEAALIVNVLQRNFVELLGPLRWAEAAPPLFLWLERVAVLVLDDDVWVLRLAPFLASCLALLLVAVVARRVLAPMAAYWATLLAAGSDRLLFHACEAKPYAVDVLLAAAALAGVVATRSWPLRRRLIVFAVVSPAAIFLSYPGAFLCGAMLLALLPQVARERRAWLAYGTWAVVVAGSFALLVLGPVRAQSCPRLSDCWTDMFPDWSRPWTVPGWSAVSTCEVVRYCFLPNGQFLTGLAALGGVALWRRGQRELVGTIGLSFALALAAAGLHHYPYGASRVEAYWAPGLAVLIAAGAAALADWLRERLRWAPVPLTALLLMVPAEGVRHTLAPWPRADCAAAAAYVVAHRQPGDAIAFNHWEYEYYFRRTAGPLFCLDKRHAPPPTGRVWVVFNATDADYRHELIDEFFNHWQRLGGREFPGASVGCFERSAGACRKGRMPSQRVATNRGIPLSRNGLEFASAAGYGRRLWRARPAREHPFPKQEVPLGPQTDWPGR